MQQFNPFKNRLVLGLALQVPVGSHLPYGGLLVSFHLLGEAPSLPLNSASLSALWALGTTLCVGMVDQLGHLCNAVFPLITINSILIHIGDSR